MATILEAIEQYQKIYYDYHVNYIGYEETTVSLKVLADSCKAGGIVFEPSVHNLEDHGSFKVERVDLPQDKEPREGAWLEDGIDPDYYDDFVPAEEDMYDEHGTLI